jgi:hypothetical protein
LIATESSLHQVVLNRESGFLTSETAASMPPISYRRKAVKIFSSGMRREIGADFGVSIAGSGAMQPGYWRELDVQVQLPPEQPQYSTDSTYGQANHYY